MKIATLLLLLAATLIQPKGAPALQKVIVDTDGDADYDDAVGVMLAAVSPELDLLGVVVTGTGADERARTVAKALAILGRDDVGVHLGELPTSPPPPFPYMAQFPPRRFELRPERGAWAREFAYRPPAESGVAFYLDRIEHAPGEIAVVVTGPLSTLARAMQAADEHGRGAEFRRAIGGIVFSGGDFETVEYNVYCDVAAARLVFGSGVPIHQFGGESGKAYLTHTYRERLWQAETPATWALQDLYRLWHAGWDPRSPFVPILYDVRPAAFLIAGEAISAFEPMAVAVDADGRLVRTGGGANVQVRVSDNPDRLLELVVARMTSRVEPAVNHLRALARAIEPASPHAAATIAAAVDRLLGDPTMDRTRATTLIAGIERELPALDQGAGWHLDMARRFLLGEPRPGAWHDPYTPGYVAIVIPLYEVAAACTPRRVAAGIVLLAMLLGAGLLARTRWRSQARA